ncbi:YigZ family protein [bacterium]|nr:YigZ family protein [bacterium]
MPSRQRYAIPATRRRVEETILRSRFVTTVGHASSVDEARAFISAVSSEFPDATHNCWAYVIGPPGDTSRVGMSDAGEPHGTAGRPMLTVLVHSGVGDIAAVVTRYYGGTKLGKGGLVRAYSGGVKNAIEGLPTKMLIASITLTLIIDYASVDPVKWILPNLEAHVLSEDYATRVTLEIELPEERADELTESVSGLTKGTALIERRDS